VHVFSSSVGVRRQSHERSLGAERQAESGRKSEKKKGEWPLHSGWAGPGATFSGVSLSGLSHNDCRRRLLTNRSAVRILFGEPYELATNSRSFWLAARGPGLAGNGQYCGEAVVLWYGNIARRSKPDAPLSHSWASFSVSPTGRVLLVNGGSSACRGSTPTKCGSCIVPASAKLRSPTACRSATLQQPHVGPHSRRDSSTECAKWRTRLPTRTPRRRTRIFSFLATRSRPSWRRAKPGSWAISRTYLRKPGKPPGL